MQTFLSKATEIKFKSFSVLRDNHAWVNKREEWTKCETTWEQQVGNLI